LEEVEGKCDCVARPDAFGSPHFCFEGEDVDARAAVGKDRRFPRRFPYTDLHAHRAESPARSRILFAYLLRVLLIDVRKMPCSLRSGSKHHLRADLVPFGHSSNPPTNLCLGEMPSNPYCSLLQNTSMGLRREWGSDAM